MHDRGGVCAARVGGVPVTFVITQPCIDTTDQSCVDVCPVDCIHFEEGTDRMLYIDPVECIDCGACEPVCPVDAIFTEDTVPADQAPYYDINVLWYQDPTAARAKVEEILGGAPAAAPAAETEAPVAEGSAESASEPAAEAEAPAGEATEEAAEALPVAQGAMQVEAVPAAVAVARPATPTPHATKADYRKAFAGFEYPVSKDAVVRQARDRGGLDREVNRILIQLPLSKYRSEDELQDAVRQLYRLYGVPEDAVPL